MTRVVVGLGNPGPEYETTRHNAGFLTVDVLGDDLNATYWKDQAGAKVALVKRGDDDLVLAKPQTFMNVSGPSVRRLLDAYGLGVADLVVVHDDLDLPAGSVRVKRGGGHGGHNGLRSLTEKLESDEYVRVRVGIGRPPGRMDPADFVLQTAKGEAWDTFADSIPRAAEAVLAVLDRGVEIAMREFNSA